VFVGELKTLLLCSSSVVVQRSNRTGSRAIKPPPWVRSPLLWWPRFKFATSTMSAPTIQPHPTFVSFLALPGALTSSFPHSPRRVNLPSHSFRFYLFLNLITENDRALHAFFWPASGDYKIGSTSTLSLSSPCMWKRNVRIRQS